MTGAAYRWTGSFGLSLGGVTTILTAFCSMLPKFLNGRLASQVWFLCSILGITLSLLSLFLHADRLDRKIPLNHRAVGFVAVALNAWPWVTWVWLYWFVITMPPG